LTIRGGARCAGRRTFRRFGKTAKAGTGSLSEDGSYGISQASVVDTDDKLAERVSFIHERIGTVAIAEQHIEGRELYVGVLGNDRLRVLPIWELEFGNMAQGAWPICMDRPRVASRK
jgi:D-alanine-D-alanine ligase